MRVLLPSDARGDHQSAETLDDAQLARLYAYPDRTTALPWVRANVVTTLDGAAQGPDHRSGSLSGPHDRRVLALLRALCDVILVGAETARTERYGPATVRREHAPLRRDAGLPATPPIAVVTASLKVPEPLLEDPRTLLFVPAAAAAARRKRLAERTEVVVAGDDVVEPRQVVDALRARGYVNILTEGGPSLLAELAAADLVDELCLTLSPLLLAGDGLRVTHGPPLTTPTAFSLAGLLEADGYLFTRWVRP